MERTKLPSTTSVTNNQLQALASQLVNRMTLASKLGQIYGGDRDVYQALGYSLSLNYADYAGKYLRQDIAKAIIDRPAKATWQGELGIQESNQAKETPLEKEWKALNERLKLKSKFSRVDRLAAIGRFGILLLGLDDVSAITKLSEPVTVGKRKLLYVKPYGEGSVKIDKYEENTSNPRYGLPLIYRISAASEEGVSKMEALVHYTRVVHVIDDVLEDETFGRPRLEAVFNRLVDLEKIIGGDAEMFWRGARPGFQGKVDPEYQMTPEAKNALKEQIDEYEHHLRRILVNEGVSYEALTQQIADPSFHVDIQIQMISAVTGIPKRILTGTERGELSSNQDSTEYRTYVQTRREDHAEQNIVRPFIDHCISIGVLPKPVDNYYTVAWTNLFAISEAETVKIGMDRSIALTNYINSPMAEAVIPPEAFMQFFLGLSNEQINLISQMEDSELIRESLAEFKQEELDIIKEEQATKPQAEQPRQSGRPTNKRKDIPNKPINK